MIDLRLSVFISQRWHGLIMVLFYSYLKSALSISREFTLTRTIFREKILKLFSFSFLFLRELIFVKKPIPQESRYLLQ